MDVTGLFDEGVPSDAGPSAESDVGGRLSIENRDDLLDIATVLTLCDARPELLFVTIESMANDLRSAVRAQGDAHRAQLQADLQLVIDTVESRLKVRQEIEQERLARRGVLAQIAELDEQIARKQAAVASAVEHEFSNRVAEAAARLEQAHKQALNEHAAATKRAQDAREAAWREAAPHRAAQLQRLEDEADRARTTLADATGRITRLTSGLITYQVARFLAWLGYASVAATGAMWTLIVKNNAADDMKSVVTSLHTFVTSLGATPLMRYGTAAGILFGSLVAILGVALATDWLLKRTFKNWGSEQDDSDKQSIRLNATSVSRRSYVQLVAALPFIFAGGLALAFLTVGPKPPDTIQNLLPTAAHTFIGSAIALLATAAFMMYALRRIEPRLRRDGATGMAWEFTLAPLALLLAVLIATIPAAPSRLMWGGWTLFMLASSLALAYGLIYDGVYDDARYAKRVLGSIEREITRALEPANDDVRAEADRREAALIDQYRAQTRSLEKSARASRLGRRTRRDGAPPTHLEASSVQLPKEHGGLVAGAQRLVARVFGRAVPTSGSPPAPAPAPVWEPLEVEVAATLVEEIGAARAQRAALQADVEDLSASIAEKVALTNWQTIDELRSKQAKLAGSIAYSEAGDRVQQALLAHGEKEVIEHVRAAIAGATKLRAPFDSVSSEAAAAIPKTPRLPIASVREGVTGHA